MNKKFPAKLLLFGEYAILAGGEALAIPYDKFELSWTQSKPSGSQLKIHLQNFCDWLKQNHFSDTLDLLQFENDLSHNLDIETNIPIGYGLGSSGAIVAAVYDRYAIKKIPDHETGNLKSMFASMENYFHSKSSGLDPLVCYLGKPIHVSSGGEIRILDFNIEQSGWKIELFDTGSPRSTAGVVERFNELMELPAYKQKIQDEYLPLVHTCISEFLLGSTSIAKDAFYKLSMLQLSSFSFAIPHDTFVQWSIGLMSNRYMKLCGAGGGGYMIILSEK